jgi:hypothetical protein
MKITFKITHSLFKIICEDLHRPHPFAAERVGFIACRFGLLPQNHLLILAHDFLQVRDDNYINDCRYGALIGPKGFSKAFDFAFKNEVGIFHVHLHPQNGQPRFSAIDKREMTKFVPDFFNVRPHLPHGGLVFSFNSIAGQCWIRQNTHSIPINNFYIIGAPVKRFNGEV